jgi:hypothetical protein
MGINRNRSKGNTMDYMEMIILDKDKMSLLIKIRDWFTTMSSRGDNIDWSSNDLGGSVYTRTMIEYLDDIIDRGGYSEREHKNVLNWMRELYIINGMGKEVISPITTI